MKKCKILKNYRPKTPKILSQRSFWGILSYSKCQNDQNTAIFWTCVFSTKIWVVARLAPWASRKNFLGRICSRGMILSPNHNPICLAAIGSLSPNVDPMEFCLLKGNCDLKLCQTKLLTHWHFSIKMIE